MPRRNPHRALFPSVRRGNELPKDELPQSGRESAPRCDAAASPGTPLRLCFPFYAVNYNGSLGCRPSGYFFESLCFVRFCCILACSCRRLRPIAASRISAGAFFFPVSGIAEAAIQLYKILLAIFLGKSKIGKPFSKLAGFLEVPPRFELGNKGFADLCLTTWPRYHMK